VLADVLPFEVISFWRLAKEQNAFRKGARRMEGGIHLALEKKNLLFETKPAEFLATFIAFTNIGVPCWLHLAFTVSISIGTWLGSVIVSFYRKSVGFQRIFLCCFCHTAPPFGL
jgi:hypothetical protein